MRTDETAAAAERDLPIARDLSPPAADPGPPGLVILYGLPGSGKTYFSHLVAERAAAVVLNSDSIRRAIIKGQPRYDGPENQRLFTALFRRADELLAQGQKVVFDSTALRSWGRAPLESIAQKHGITPVRVHLDPPEEIILQRMSARQPPPDPTDAAKTWRDVYEWMKPGWQPINEPHLRLVDPATANLIADRVHRLLPAGGNGT